MIKFNTNITSEPVELQSQKDLRSAKPLYTGPFFLVMHIQCPHQWDSWKVAKNLVPGTLKSWFCYFTFKVIKYLANLVFKFPFCFHFGLFETFSTCSPGLPRNLTFYCLSAKITGMGHPRLVSSLLKKKRGGGCINFNQIGCNPQLTPVSLVPLCGRLGDDRALTGVVQFLGPTSPA